MQNSWVIDVLNILYWWPVYLCSLVYCILGFRKSYNKTSLDGVTGTTPGLDAIPMVVGAPFYAGVDLASKVIDWIKSLSKAFNNKG